ncbi:hypothetical protein V6Z11_A01G083400 [Gossypium hirsutum]
MMVGALRMAGYSNMLWNFFRIIIQLALGLQVLFLVTVSIGE